MSNFTDQVYAIVRRIPRGRVVSYGGVAAILGRPRAARGVGMALNALPPDTDVPWWRVINRLGRISYPHPGGTIQRMMLAEEGVEFGEDGAIDWERFGWEA